MDIQIPALWNKFKEKFSLDTNQPQAITLKTSVQPVTVIDEIYIKSGFYRSTIYVTGLGEKIAFTVPDGETWEMFGIMAEVAASKYTFSGIEIGPGWGRQYLLEDAGLTRIFTGILPRFYLNTDDNIIINVDAFTVAASFNCDIMCIKHQY